MTTEAKKIASIGFVDTFENGHFTGWTYTNQKANQEITLKINSYFIRSIRADVTRQDVKNAGIDAEHCGFDFNIDLDDLPEDGCFISLHESVFDKPLENGTFRYQKGTLTQHATADESRELVPVKTYISVYESASTSLSHLTLLDLAISVLSDAPLSTFIAMSYLLILGRTPDPDGFHNYLQHQLSSNSEKRKFLLNMIDSAEFKTKRSIASATTDLEKYSA